MQDRSPPIRQSSLATHGRTIHWVKHVVSRPRRALPSFTGNTPNCKGESLWTVAPLWARWPQLAPPFRCSTKSPAPRRPLKTKNVVFVHGLFADGSSWSKVIPRLQEKGINCTSVQNPLTSLQEASEAARRAIALQPGPTVLVGHSFSGMIVTEVGVDPKITALVYVAARAPCR